MLARHGLAARRRRTEDKRLTQARWRGSTRLHGTQKAETEMFNAVRQPDRTEEVTLPRQPKTADIHDDEPSMIAVANTCTTACGSVSEPAPETMRPFGRQMHNRRYGDDDQAAGMGGTRYAGYL
jgi:hypothetical protein